MNTENSCLTPQNLDLKTHYSIIVAGGSGSRMNSAIPKQFLLLNGKPVLMHTIEAFNRSNTSPVIIVVLPNDYHEYWQQQCNEYQFKIAHQLVNGGNTRFQSVKNGLNFIQGNAIVAIHDAVRPLTSSTVIDDAFNYANTRGNCIVAVQSKDSIRQLKNGVTNALLRDEIYLVQTPQVFEINILREAYQQQYDPAFTDDASVVEKLGLNINIITGNYTNIKITFPEDIAIAEMILNSNK